MPPRVVPRLYGSKFTARKFTNNERTAGTAAHLACCICCRILKPGDSNVSFLKSTSGNLAERELSQALIIDRITRWPLCAYMRPSEIPRAANGAPVTRKAHENYERCQTSVFFF